MYIESATAVSDEDQPTPPPLEWDQRVSHLPILAVLVVDWLVVKQTASLAADRAVTTSQ